MKTNKFEMPKLEVICVELNDVVAASPSNGDNDDLGEDIFDEMPEN